MSRPARNEPSLDPLLSEALSLEEKLHFAQMVRESSADSGRRIEQFLLANVSRLLQGLHEAEEKIGELGEVVAKLAEPPMHLAIFLKAVATPKGEHALVIHGTSQRVVGLGEGIAVRDLRPGDEVFLAHNLNMILAKSPHGGRLVGETALFEHKQSNGALVLKSRDEELIVEAAPDLAEVSLAAGDLVRFDRTALMAFEKVERAKGHKFILEEVPDIGIEQIGGLDEEVETVFSALTMSLTHPEVAAAYGLGGRMSILMIGPPGCGKTLMGRLAASRLKQVSAQRCRFAVVKPAEWESPFVGETQANIRNFFKSLREAAADGLVVAFLDEIEAIGRTRGSRVDHHNDKFLAAFLAELDGFTDRKNIAIISATNRKDLIDGALLERISDIEIPVGRPTAKAAREIFGIHLPPTMRFCPNGSEARATREQLIETAVSRFYSPNADNAVSVIRFRDGKERSVAARELVSGRIFEQVCRDARTGACRRELRREGEPGLRVADIEEAASNAIEKMRSTLSVENAHSYLPDLPQDVSVVSVQPVARKVKKPNRYLNV